MGQWHDFRQRQQSAPISVILAAASECPLRAHGRHLNLGLFSNGDAVLSVMTENREAFDGILNMASGCLLAEY